MSSFCVNTPFMLTSCVITLYLERWFCVLHSTSTIFRTSSLPSLVVEKENVLILVVKPARMRMVLSLDRVVFPSLVVVEEFGDDIVSRGDDLFISVDRLAYTYY